jgi:hypothetical protein
MLSRKESPWLALRVLDNSTRIVGIHPILPVSFLSASRKYDTFLTLSCLSAGYGSNPML